MASRDSGFGHGASFNNQTLSAGITPRLRSARGVRAGSGDRHVSPLEDTPPQDRRTYVRTSITAARPLR